MLTRRSLIAKASPDIAQTRPDHPPLSVRLVGSNFFWLLLFVTLLCIPRAILAFPERVKIAGIEVRGTKRTHAKSVINTFGLTEGKEYPYEDVQDGLRRIYHMNLFSNVRLLTKHTPQGDSLIIEVVERPVVKGITISGNRKIGKGDIRSKIELAVGSTFDERLLEKSLKAIRSLYKGKGYYLADVTYETKPAGKTGVSLIFRINEGVKVKAEKIDIEGNRALSDKALKKIMETKERGWFSGKDYNPEVLEQDLERIIGRYRDEGFMQAHIVEHSVDIDKKKKVARIRIKVNEGPRLYISKVGIELNNDVDLPHELSQEVLHKAITLKPGDPYSESEYDKTLENLYSILGDYGYMYAQIEPNQNFRGDSVSLTFRVDPQRAVRVHKIIIEGNETTLEKVIRRELVIHPGDILRRSLIERSHREVFNLGYFEDIQVGSRVANEQGDIDLVFKVKERQTGVANVGAGYSEEFGLTGFVEFAHNNVGFYRKFPFLGLGKGQTLNLRWEFGKLDQIELSYRDPWFRDRPILVGFDLYDTRREYDTYTDKRSGFGLVFGRRISWINYSRVYLRYSLERREIDPNEQRASEWVKSQAGTRTTSSVILSFIRNSVDNPFFPRTGSRTSLTCEWAGAVLGGNTAYQSYILESSNFISIPLLKSAFVFKVRTGIVDELGGGGYIPIYERFRLGGSTLDGVRGYGDRTIVPEGNAIDEGGRFMLIGTMEYRIPVVENRAHVLVFLDAGDTWNSFRAARPGILRRSAGVGFRIEIPMMGQLGLDVGYGFDRDEAYGGPGWETHFQFGTAGY